MSISNATEHLAKALLVCYGTEDQAAKMLGKIAEIPIYVKNENLVAWETAVLSTVDDLDALEQRHDFPLIESIWEVGRFNLFGVIQEEQTRELYTVASKRLKDAHGLRVKPVSEFDFSKW
jgi:hypothetical protein